jgi:hypothetical protein
MSPPAKAELVVRRTKAAKHSNFLIILTVSMVYGCKDSKKTVKNRKNDEKNA